MKMYNKNDEEEKDLKGKRIAIEDGEGLLRVGYGGTKEVNTFIVSETEKKIPIGKKDRGSKGNTGLEAGKNCLEVHFKNTESIQVFIDQLQKLKEKYGVEVDNDRS